MSTLCDICKRALRTILDFPTDRYHFSTRPSAPHQPSFGALKGSAYEGCRLCQLFCQCISEELDTLKDSWLAGVWRDEEHLEVSFAITAMLRETEPGAPLRSVCTSFVLETEQREDVDVPGFIGFDVIDLGNSDLGFAGRMISTEPDPSFARPWISQCAETHAQCPALYDRPLPTRLIDVGDATTEPRLVLTEGQTGRYVALSHCWGSSDPPATERGNLEKYYTSIPFITLPLTLRDAVCAVRKMKLGTRYLWIDCFCILQDDPDDFQRECTRMAATFANATVTICGPSAANAETGFLANRDMGVLEAPHTLRFEISMRNRTAVLMAVRSASFPGHLYRFRKQAYSPLNLRAWIAQERILSPRMLFFGKHQLYMECAAAEYYEFSRFAFGKIAKTALQLNIDTLSSSELYWQWEKIVNEYCKCRITDGNDKLPALSGTASVFARRLGDTYLAGIWRLWLVQGLAWRRVRGSQAHGHAERLSSREAIKAPPLWSWASCDYPVTTLQVSEQFFKPLCVVDASVQLAGLDPHGQVSCGQLRISAITKPAAIARYSRCGPDAPVPYWEKFEFDMVVTIDDWPDQAQEVSSMWRDSPTYKPQHIIDNIIKPHESVLVVLLGTVKSRYGTVDNPWQWLALVLQPAHSTSGEGMIDPSSDQPFHRVGFIHVDRGVDGQAWHDETQDAAVWKWMKSGDMRTLTII